MPISDSPTGRMIDLHNWRERTFKPAAKAAGVEAVPYVAAMAGHSPRVCLERYAHAFAEAQLGASAQMAKAITEARRKLDVRPLCDVRILRASA